MNPLHDAIISLNPIDLWTVDARHDPKGAQTLHERIALQRAEERTRARQRRQRLAEAVGGAVASAYRRLTGALQPQEPSGRPVGCG
ncbi:MAG: hypothetical protein NXI21_02135 [Alphaproteobacteria bacterium]|nr:hypothetical protein [Alphaproteobacteria bacterium]